MSFQLLQSDAILPLSFLATGLVSVVPMKLVSRSKLSTEDRKKIPTAFYLSPLYSVLSWDKARPAREGDLKFLLKQWVLPLFAFLDVFCAYGAFIHHFNINLIYKSYLAVFPFYLMTETVGILIQILFLFMGYLIPPTHLSPLRSKHLGEFWAKRWNPWMATWLKQVIYPSFRNNSYLGILAVFLFSGVWHELLLNLPFYLFRGISLFGTLTAYFLIQGIGVILDKKLLEGSPSFYRILWLWVVVLVPSPLFLNKATLKIFLLD
jgi:hypothetical protein